MDWIIYAAIVIVSAIISVALAPKPPVPRPPELTDVDAPTAEEGKPIPVIFGDVWVKGSNVVWFGDLGTDPIKKSNGKK